MTDPKVFILGRDRVGWAIDQERGHLQRALGDLGIPVTSNVVSASIVFLVLWSAILDPKIFLLKTLFRRKKFVVLITNDLSDRQEEIMRSKRVVDTYVCPSSKHMETLRAAGIEEAKLFYCPHYSDERIFHPSFDDRESVASQLGIDPFLLRKKLIGNFQRDSLGSDLTKPKWQKNPDLMIDIVVNVCGSNTVLLLAGPRRHYVVRQCEKRGIPYYYFGDETFISRGIDDIRANMLTLEQMSMLYSLIDLYILSSTSEGGQKAFVEATLLKKPLLTTDAGMARDLLDPRCIYTDKDDAVNKARKILGDEVYRHEIVEKSYEKVSALNNYESFRSRIKDIIMRQVA